MTIHQPSAPYVTLQDRKGTAYRSVGETQGCHLTNTWHRDLSSGQPYPRPRSRAKPEPGRPTPGWRCTPLAVHPASCWPCTPQPERRSPLGVARCPGARVARGQSLRSPQQLRVAIRVPLGVGPRRSPMDARSGSLSGRGCARLSAA